jgi:hypothetical protein
VELLEQALHDDRPASRLQRLQHQIDITSASRYQAIVLGYGLCSLALEGLQARELPVAIPRAHDCITLYLGSRQRYDAEFAATPGTFYYSDDYMERQAEVGSTGRRRVSMGALTSFERDYEELVAKFGEDNAQYLMEALGQWQQHYQRAAYIETGLGKSGPFQERAEAEARQYDWRFEKLKGDLQLVRKLLTGEWDEDFLVLQPGQRVVVTHDSGIIAAGGDSTSSDASIPST